MIVVPSNGNAGVVRREQKQRTIILNLGQSMAVPTGAATQDFGAASNRHSPGGKYSAPGAHPRKQSNAPARPVFTSPPARGFCSDFAGLSRLDNYAAKIEIAVQPKTTRCRNSVASAERMLWNIPAPPLRAQRHKM
jgi:hypothetical protein